MELQLLFVLSMAFILHRVEAVECPDGKQWFEHENVCAKVSLEMDSWRTADTECRMSKGRSLHLSVEDGRDDSELLDWLRRNRHIYQTNSYYWTGASIPAFTLPSYYQRCGSGHKFRGVCYDVVISKKTWSEASSYCIDSGGQLAHIDDVETSKAVARAFREVTAQIPQYARDAFDGYWIDGKMNNSSSQFIDKFGDSFNYTNMAPSHQSNLLHGPHCREVSVVAFENSFNSSFIKASDCEQKLPSVCEFSLGGLSSGKSYFEKALKQHNKQKNGLNEDKSDIDNSLLFTPSHVSSCEDIVILSKLGREMKENLLEMDDKMLIDVTLLDVFIDARSGYFILSNKPSEGSKERTSFKLTYCDLEATLTKLEQTEKITERDSAVQLYLMMFSWGSFDVIDEDIDGKEIAKASPLRLSHYNQFQINDNFTFLGPCVFVDAVQGQWHTSPCKRFLPYICEYTPYGARKVDEKEKTKPSSVISTQLDSLLIEMDGQNETFHQLDSSRMLAAVELMRKIVGAGQQQNSYLLSFRSSSFLELDALLHKTLPVVHSLHVSFGATMVDTENIAIQAVSTLAENVADKFTKEQTNNGDMKSVNTLAYENPSSEIRIVLLDETIAESTERTNITFKPHMIERSTSISVFPDQSQQLFSGSTGDRAAVIFAVYKFEGDQSPTKAQMAPSFITSGDGNTHVQLNQFNDAQWRVGTPIISATLRIAGQSVPVPVQFTLPRFSFANVEMITRSEMCSYLTYTDQSSVWSDTGCYQQHEHKDEMYRCSCNHTTDFAVLLLVYVSTDTFQGHSFSMFVLSMIGESLSVIALASTLVVYITLRSFLKSDRFMVHMNLAAALLVTHLILITSRLCVGPTQHDATTSIDEVACTALALLLHFSLLSSFCWMSVEGYILYKKILIVLARETQIIQRRHYVLGWSFPILIVIFSYGICQITGVPYNDQRCWLSVQNGVLWSVVGPAIIMLTVNFIIMVRVLCVAVATQRRRYRRRIGSVGSGVVFKTMWRSDVKVAARGLIFLAPLLGISWVFGFLAGVNVVCAYTFIFCNAFQGLYLFIFYVVLNPEVRSAWQEKKLSQARNLLNKSDLPEVSGSQHKHWFRRLSTSLFSRISFSPPSSGNNTPTSEDIKSNSVKDFVGVTLPSRPSSARSIADRVRAAASSMTILREKAERVNPNIEDMAFSEDDEDEWECVSDCDENQKHDSKILDVSCEPDPVHVNVEKLPRFFQNPLPCAAEPFTDRIPAMKTTSNTTLGDIAMFGIINPVFTASEDSEVKKTSIHNKIVLSGELPTKTAKPKILKKPKRETKLVCHSPMCRECNNKPLAGARKKQRPHTKKAATKSKIRRPATTGVTKRDRAKQGQRRQQQLKRQAWTSNKPAHLNLTEALDLQVDQASYFLGQSLQTLPNDKRPQSTGSHDSGIVITP